MSGHSKWATTKRAKAIVDAKRSNLFTKLSNNITIAAKEGGGDPATNFKLRIAVDKAKSASMPKDNIERAIKRGTGELGGAVIEEVIYGALLPGKVVVIIKCLTDNKNKEELELMVIDAGAEDLTEDEEEMTIFTNPKKLQKVKEALESLGLKIVSADLEMVAKEKVSLEGEALDKVIKFYPMPHPQEIPFLRI